MDVSLDGKLYVTDYRPPEYGWGGPTSVLEVDPASGTTRAVVNNFPGIYVGRILVGDGSADFGSDLYVSDNNAELSQDCCGGGIFRIDRQTGSFVQPSGALRFTDTGGSDEYGLAFAPTGSAFGPGLYIMDGTHTIFGRPSIFRWSGGNITRFAYFPDFDTGSPSELAFGPTEGFGGDLYVADGYVQPNAIFRVKPDGSYSKFLEGIAGSMAFGRGGPFGTDLYVLSGTTIYRVTPSGAKTVFVAGLPDMPRWRPVITFSPDGSQLFVGVSDRVLAVQANPTPESKGPIHWWSGDGNALDQVGTAHGQLFGGATFEPGILGQSFSFDGLDDYMSIGQPLSMAAGTVEFWVWRRDPTQEYNVFIGSYNEVDAAPTFYSRGGIAGDGFVADFSTQFNVSVTQSLPRREWHHVAMAWGPDPAGGKLMTVYLDGVRVNQRAFQFRGTSLAPLFVGAMNRGRAVQHANGRVDELKIYNRALTDGEIRDSYRMLAHWWPGDGSAADQVGDTPGQRFGDASFAPGIVGQAFSFDGVDDYMSIGQPLSLAAGTVEFWLLRREPRNDYNVFFGSYDEVNRGPSLYSYNGDAFLAELGDQFNLVVSPALARYQWQHVAMTWQTAPAGGQTMAVYLNGALVTRRALQFPGTSLAPLFVGAMNRGRAVQHANGLVDELKLYRRALSDADIAQIYAATPIPPPASQNVTPTGANISVTPVDSLTGVPSPTTISFQNVGTAGITTVTSGTMGTTSGPPQPNIADYWLAGSSTYLNIESTASFGGYVTVCVKYAGAAYGDESKVRLLHYEYGTWKDITTSVDMLNDLVCGRTTSLSPFVVAETNYAPVVTGISLPGGPVPVNTEVSLTASFTDANPTDSHDARVNWESVTTPGTVTNSRASAIVTASHSYPAAGVYTVDVDVTDAGGKTGSRRSTLDVPAYIVVYDPSAGFATGGGWIDSPAGACQWDGCATDGSTVGKATFGFVSRYQRGATKPSGNTEFEFRAGGLRFKSTSYEWLVVGGPQAQYKGQGTIDGAGSYGFLLTAIDGQASGGGGTDKFRIKIWDSTGRIVYDNRRGELEDSPSATPLGGGSIVIQSN
jgi:hypothetical protein